jgi:hypothetical protein
MRKARPAILCQRDVMTIIEALACYERSLGDAARNRHTVARFARVRAWASALYSSAPANVKAAEAVLRSIRDER